MGRRRDDRDSLEEEMRDRVQSLERRLDEAQVSRRRADDIIEQLTRANTGPSEQRTPEGSQPGSADDASLSPPSWQETLKTITPLGAATVSGLFTVLAAAEGATVVAVVGFVIAVIAAGTGIYFGVRLQVERRQQRLLMEATRKAAEQALKITQTVKATAQEALEETQTVKALAEEALERTQTVNAKVEETLHEERATHDTQDETREGS